MAKRKIKKPSGAKTKMSAKAAASIRAEYLAAPSARAWSELDEMHVEEIDLPPVDGG